jgi:phosphatidylglycerol---prolipoprotein diacylglyceryl transferase
LLPYLFQSGNFALPTYGVAAALGLVLGLLVAVRFARRDGIDEDKAWNLGVLTIFSGIVGAKLLLVVTDWGYYSRHLGEIASFNMLQAGGVWYGGFLGGVIAGILYVRKHHLPVLRTWDAFTPGIALGHAIGRLGCLAAGCCYGKPTDVPWGIVFTDPLANQLTGTPLGVRMHPTQIYEFLAEIAIFFLLVQLIRHYRRLDSHPPQSTALAAFPGQITGTYAFLYGIARYSLEFFRDDPQRGSVFGGLMTATQLISICLVILGGALWLRRPGPARELAAPTNS